MLTLTTAGATREAAVTIADRLVAATLSDTCCEGEAAAGVGSGSTEAGPGSARRLEEARGLSLSSCDCDPVARDSVLPHASNGRQTRKAAANLKL
jgi:hypothetical protein